MAIEKVIKINVDQVQASGGLEKFVEGLNKTEKSTQSLRTELKNLKQQLAELPEGTAQYNEIAKKAGEVSDKISDISTRVKNLGSDTKNIDAVVQGAQTLSGAFTVATSATQLFGVENEDLQKSMAKVEAAIGLTVGIQSISNALQKESALYIGLSNVATKVQIGLQVAYAAVVGTTTGALKALRVALVSTGVGALVVALGFLIAKLQDSVDATEDQKEAQERLNSELEKSNKLFSEELKGIEYVTNARKLRAQIAGKSEKDLQQIEKEGHEDRLKAIEDERQRLEKQLNDKANSVETSKKINDALAKNTQAFIDEVNAAELKGLQSSLDIVNKRREAEKKAEEERKSKLKKEEEERKKRQEEELADLKAFQQKVTDAYINQFDIDIQNKQRQVDAIAALGEQNTKDEEKQAEERKEIARLEAEAKKTYQDSVFENISNGINLLSGVFGKDKALRKALLIAESATGIAKIVVNTQAANSAARLKYALIPGGAALAAAEISMNQIGAGIGIAANVAATAKALSALGGGGSSNGGASNPNSPTSGSTNAPSFNIVGQNPNNQLAQSIAQKQQQPIQAYVVSGNVTNAQSLDRNRVDTATFN